MTLTSVCCSSAIEKRRKKKSKEKNERKSERKKKRKVIDIDSVQITIVCSHHYHSKMPSFKERFRSSRKYKKNKEAGATGTDESAPTASGISTNAPTTIDDHTGSAALSTYSSHYSVDYRE